MVGGKKLSKKMNFNLSLVKNCVVGLVRKRDKEPLGVLLI